MAKSRLDVLHWPTLSVCMHTGLCGCVVHTSLAAMEETEAIAEDLAPAGFRANAVYSSCGK